jgi:cob(I)alamin adenosyltransferase
MKIYTKKGDGGETSLIGGTRVPKHHIRVDAYGSTDELNVYIGLIADQQIDTGYKNVLNEIQDRLFTIGAALASDPNKSKMAIPDLKESDITFLEEQIDAMELKLPVLQNFILPEGILQSHFAI